MCAGAHQTVLLTEEVEAGDVGYQGGAVVTDRRGLVHESDTPFPLHDQSARHATQVTAIHRLLVTWDRQQLGWVVVVHHFLIWITCKGLLNNTIKLHNSK